MTSRSMKRCSTPLIRETQIKPQLDITAHLSERLSLKKQQITVLAGEIGSLVPCWWKCKMGQLLWVTIWWFLNKLKIELPYDPAVTFLGIYPNVLRAGSWKVICATMAIVLFTVAKTWKHPCQLTDECIKEMWCIHSKEYATKIEGAGGGETGAAVQVWNLSHARWMCCVTQRLELAMLYCALTHTLIQSLPHC